MSDLGAAILGSLMAQLGFETIGRSTIMQRLSNIQPGGETALRDATEAGIKVILKLNQTFNELGAGGAWNFVHIVITDGVDTASSTSLHELSMLFAVVGQRIPREKCLTVFIGIDLSPDAVMQLSLLTALGGDTCQMYNVNKVQLNKFFPESQPRLVSNGK